MDKNVTRLTRLNTGATGLFNAGASVVSGRSLYSICPRPMESIGDPMESELSVVEFIIFYIILDI